MVQQLLQYRAFCKSINAQASLVPVNQPNVIVAFKFREEITFLQEGERSDVRENDLSVILQVKVTTYMPERVVGQGIERRPVGGLPDILGASGFSRIKKQPGVWQLRVQSKRRKAEC